jgi:uncharacterized protein YbjT (DUF2867 family)
MNSSSTTGTKSILIIGATGTVSSLIIEQLRDSAHRIVALVRNPEKVASLAQSGIEVRAGDLEQPWTLVNAFAGIDTVWLLTPAGPRAPEQSFNAVYAARRAGVGHIVRMSAFGAAHDAPAINGRLHALSDAELIASGVSHTIIKPHFFMQNLLMAASGIARDGILYFALGEARLAAIDARDVAAFATQVLTTPGHEGRQYTLTGPASITMHEVAAAFAGTMGRPIRYQPVPVEAARQSVLEMGADPWSANMLCDYLAAYSSAWGDRCTTDFEALLGRPPRTIGQFAKDHAALIRS